MANDAMVKLKKNQFIPFIGTAGSLADINAVTWSRIDLSTIFELTMGEQEEDFDYICYENPVTEISSNKPELPQEIALYEGNALYDWMMEHFYGLPTGSACKVPFLMCFGGTDAYAWECTATITSKVLNTVDGKFTFTIKLGGDIVKGTYTISTAGVPTFTPASSENVDKKGKK